MPPSLQDRISVVLVRARNPSNIGAVARAMHDLGFADLRIVNDYPVPFQAARSAVDASSVLDAARQYASLADAVADRTLVIGTTAVGERTLEHPLAILREAAAGIERTLASSDGSRVALLFGSEKTGLSNEELSHCQLLLTIPMNPHAPARHLSMNLGQAVAVCLYELVRNQEIVRDQKTIRGEDLIPNPIRDQNSVGEHTPATVAAPLEAAAILPNLTSDAAAAGDLERLSHLLTDVFERSGYSRRHPANAHSANVRRLLRRMMLSTNDAAVWTGILRQILHALGGLQP